MKSYWRILSYSFHKLFARIDDSILINVISDIDMANMKKMKQIYTLWFWLKKENVSVGG